MRFYKLLLALVAGAAAQPALAGAQAVCIAANMPAESQQQAVDSYLKGGMETMEPPAAPVLLQLVGKCLPASAKRDKDVVLRFSMLIASHLSLEAAEVALVRRHGLNEAGIDTAWARLAPEHRARFSRAGKSDELSTRAMIAFAGALRPDIPQATLDGLRGSVDKDGSIKAILPFIFDATLYGMSRGVLETER